MIQILLFIIMFFVLWFVIRLLPKKKFYRKSINLYFGPPGCGKTTFIAQDNDYINRKMQCTVFTNISLPFSYKIDKSYFGVYKLPSDAVILFDEASLNGYDNRDYKVNFAKAPQQLSYFKLIRHYKNRIVFTNQGHDELDLKIRTLTEYVWIVKSVGSFSVATRLKKDSVVDKDTHEIVEGYFMPNLLAILINPYVTRIVYRKKYYEDFDSFALPEELPPVPMEPWQSDSIGLANDRIKKTAAAQARRLNDRFKRLK